MLEGFEHEHKGENAHVATAGPIWTEVYCW